MFEKVLVPTDFSEHAKKTIVCLTRIPGVREVVLQHVINATHYTKRGWTHETEIENAKIQMDEGKKVLERLGFSVKVKIDVITSGSISAAILTAAECEKVSFIIMGSRGRGLVRGLLLGSVSADVLRQGKTHLLIIRHSVATELNGTVFDKFCPGIFLRVLCPTDFSDAAQTAVSMLKRIEGIGEIHVLHVVTKGETHDEIEAHISEAKERLEAIKTDLSASGFRVETHIRLGHPTHEITTLADEVESSLILMSSHGNGMLTEILVGSTTLGVAIHAKRPMMVIRTPAQLQK